MDTEKREFDEGVYFTVKKSYNREFKIAAVKLVLDDDMSVASVAKKLSINCSTLYRWINEYEEYGENAFPVHGSILYSYQFENKKLKNFQDFLNKKHG